MYDRKWCRPCALKWQRENPKWKGPNKVHDFSPAWELEIPERYQAANLTDLPKSITKKLLELPDDVGFYLWGSPGIGKTHTMAAFAKHFWIDGWDIRRITYDWLLLEIRDTFKTSAIRTEKEILEPLIEVGKLFIEDVGTTVSIDEQESDFSHRTFTQLLDKRIEYCRATFVTGNKSVEELRGSFDGRVASRIQQACQVVKLTGSDSRATASKLGQKCGSAVKFQNKSSLKSVLRQSTLFVGD